MKAVNLLPSEYRRGDSTSLRDASPITLAVLGAMLVVLIVVAGYVVFSNDVASRKNELARITARSEIVQRQAAALKPYAALATIQDQTLSQVRTLADGRYDWAAILARMARVLPRDVTLTSLNGTMPSATATAAPSTTPGTTTPPSGPSVQLAGCTSSHTEVGRTMVMLRGLDGVSDVQLQSSTEAGAGAGTTAGSGGCARADQFNLTVQLDALPAPAAQPATAAAGTPAAPSTGGAS